MSVSGSGLNTFKLTASGDSVIGINFIRDVRVVFSAGAAGNSALLADGQNSDIYHCIADAANYTDGWPIMKEVNGFSLSKLTGDAEVFVNVIK